MDRPLFYAPEFPDQNILPEAEQHHAVRTLRLKTGDHIIITNGKGLLADAILYVEGKKVTYVVTLEKELSPPPPLYLAIAPTKNSDRIEWLIEKATEIGIREVFLIQTLHTERPRIKTERLRQKAVQAMKQSQRAHLPLIHDMMPFSGLLQLQFKHKLLAHFQTSNQHLKDAVSAGEEVLAVVGPEGDFSPEEIEMSKNNGFRLINLGQNRLRTETAALYICMEYAIINR